MNSLKKCYCRTYQKIMYLACFLLPWRKPELLEFDNGVLGLPEFIKNKGIERVLLVTDEGLKNLGLCDGLVNKCAEVGLKCAWYYKAVPNPTIDNIEEALKMYKENDCQAIIAFGGGSPMDCAKGVGARVACPNKQVPQMKGILKVTHKLPPLYAIPTTAGTGSETTLAAVISNPQTHEKYPINDPHLIPQYAVLDASLTVGLPQKITSTTGVDALTHAVEAYIGSANTKETKEMAIKATKLIFENLKKAYDNGKDMEARSNMQKAAFYAGVAFTRAYVGNVHAIAHTLGGFYGVPHGLANAIILPIMLDEYGESAYKKLAELADVVGIQGADDAEKAQKFIQAIKDLNASMNIPKYIENTIKDEDIPTLAKRAEAEANPLYPCPKLFDVDEFQRLYYTIQGK
ncbi:MAG: iron-containing alcohol dehydrogenase [Clostridia bacterium]|nr:iron-containing alcohol dehydrogenase [Clostridia bacterium]